MDSDELNELKKLYEEMKVLAEDPITERLRGVPFDNWTLSDIAEEKAALQKRIEDNTNAHDTIGWLLDVTKALHEKFPDLPMVELVELLPEPERSIAHDIANPPSVKFSDLPLERTNRQPWHEEIERAVVTTLLKREEFTLAEVLDTAGIKRTNVQVRAAGERYAKRLLEATSPW